MSKPVVLIVEDDYAIIRGLIDSFHKKGYEVHTAMDGEKAIELALSVEVDLILLDVMLPGVHGFEVCRRIREAHIETPIIMLTAKNAEADVVQGLNVGADDYVTKPFSIIELHARVEAFMRRHRSGVVEMISFGKFTLNVSKMELQDESGPVKLTPKEYAMLVFLIKNKGKALTRDTLLNAVWKSDILTTRRSVDRCITTLRKKIEDNPKTPQFVISVRDVGYLFQEECIVNA